MRLAFETHRADASMPAMIDAATDSAKSNMKYCTDGRINGKFKLLLIRLPKSDRAAEEIAAPIRLPAAHT